MSDLDPNATVTQLGFSGPYTVTYGHLHQEWKSRQHPETWGTLTFEEWVKIGGTQEYFPLWKAQNRK